MLHLSPVSGEERAALLTLGRGFGNVEMCQLGEFWITSVLFEDGL